jgi:hypothetical protein
MYLVAWRCNRKMQRVEDVKFSTEVHVKISLYSREILRESLFLGRKAEKGGELHGLDTKELLYNSSLGS